MRQFILLALVHIWAVSAVSVAAQNAAPGGNNAAPFVSGGLSQTGAAAAELGQGNPAPLRTGLNRTPQNRDRDQRDQGEVEARWSMPLGDLMDYIDEPSAVMPGYNHDHVTGYGNDLLWMDFVAVTQHK